MGMGIENPVGDASLYKPVLANQGVCDIIEISQFVELAFSLRERCAKTFFVCIQSPTHNRHKRTQAKMVKLSPPRFNVAIG
jgi:hypothetical protein